MNQPPSNLERLITRYIDEECSPEERKQLQEMLREDSAAAEFYDDTVGIEREFNVALRSAMGRPPVRRLRPPVWPRISRLIGFGLAAAAAILVWISPGHRGPSGQSNWRSGDKPAEASWFAPPPAVGDVLDEDYGRFGRPQVKLEKPERNWIVVPGEKRGEFMVIEIKSSRTRTIPLQEDF
jgi:hypothetical protein